MRGLTMVTATVGSTLATDVPVVLAQGVHQLRLAGTLANQDGQVALRWGTGNGELGTEAA